MNNSRFLNVPTRGNSGEIDSQPQYARDPRNNDALLKSADELIKFSESVLQKTSDLQGESFVGDPMDIDLKSTDALIQEAGDLLEETAKILGPKVGAIGYEDFAGDTFRIVNGPDGSYLELDEGRRATVVEVGQSDLLQGAKVGAIGYGRMPIVDIIANGIDGHHEDISTSGIGLVSDPIVVAVQRHDVNMPSLRFETIKDRFASGDVDTTSPYFDTDSVSLVSKHSFIDPCGRKVMYTDRDYITESDVEETDTQPKILCDKKDMEILAQMLNIISQLLRGHDEINTMKYPALSEEDISSTKGTLAIIYRQIYGKDLNVYDNGFELAFDRLNDHLDGLIYSSGNKRQFPESK